MSAARILLLVDTPNLYRSATQRYGPGTRIDYRAFRQTIGQTGRCHCEAMVNDGVSPGVVEYLSRLHYAVTYSHARDCDEMLIARAVALHRSADSVIVASGDGKNIELIRLLKTAGKHAFVAGITGSIHHGLREVADAVIEFPVLIERNCKGSQAA